MMDKRKRILSGILALAIGLSVAMPMRASANDNHWWDHHHDHGDQWNRQHDPHYHEWRWEKDHDHYRAYTYAPGYGYRQGDGQGMLDPRNPNLFWACDSEGHHCHWAER